MSAAAPSRTYRADPSTSDGIRSWTRTMNRPPRARRTRIAGCVSGQRPLTATMTVVAIKKVQATMRTTRS